MINHKNNSFQMLWKTSFQIVFFLFIFALSFGFFASRAKAESNVMVNNGQAHSCAIGENGNIYCWGVNSDSQLGDNSTTYRSNPVRVLKGASVSSDNDGTYLTNIKSVALGYHFTCAVSNSGNVYCWGNNDNSQMGNGTYGSDVPTPVRVLKGTSISGENDGTYLTNIRSIATAHYHTCAISNNDNIYCWGYNYNGGLGDNSKTDRSAPVRVLKGEAVSGDNDGTYLTNVRMVDGGSNFTCAVSKNNNTYCWGQNSIAGDLGDNTSTDRLTPIRVLKGSAASGDNDGTYLNNILSISAGNNRTCAISNAGNAYCWGYNNFGALGDNTTSDKKTPIRVLKGSSASGDNDGTNLTNIKMLIGNQYHTCVVSNNDNTYCWGYNAYGQLGDNSTTNRYTPVRVLKGEALDGDNDGTYFTNIRSLSTGYYHTCSISNNNNTYCWGSKIYGTMGENNTVPTLLPGEGGSGYLNLGSPPPTITGVTDGAVYFTSVTPITTNGTATLNGSPYISGATITDDGTYTLTVVGTETSISATFTIIKSKTVYDPNPTKINGDYDLTIITIAGSDATATTQATVNIPYTLVSGSNSMAIPANTIITPTSGTMDITQLTTVNILETVNNENSNSKGAVKIGITDQPVTFSNPVTVTMDVQSSYNNETLTIYSRPDSGGDWTYETTCTVTDNQCTFNTSHATTYTANYEVSNSPTPTDVNLDLSATISIDCDDTVNLGTITGTGQSSLTTNEADCNVKTINSNGYQLSWQASTPYMENTDGDQIAPYTPATPDTPEVWNVEASASEWGARVKSTSTDPDLTSGAIWGSSGDTYAGRFLNIDTSSFTIANRAAETSPSGSDETILFGAEIGANRFQPTGTYSANVTITATTL